MANSTRQEILNEWITILGTLSTLKHVELKKITPVDLETVVFPCAFLFGGAEQKLNDGRAVIGYENWLWRVTLEVWGKDQDMEALLKEIHDLMWTNRSIGGHAVTSERVGVDFLVVDVEQSVEAGLIDFDVIYRHTKGVM
jgi:hypothetical protein